MKPTVVFDTEIFGNYFLVAFLNVATGNVVCMERTPEQELDISKLLRILNSYRLISFNGNHFDMVILAAALSGADNATIKAVCDAIIVQRMKPWDVYRAFGLHQIEDLDHIDLIEVCPGHASLKQYGGRLHAPTIADLPLAPDAVVTPEQRLTLLTYCANDLRLTQQIFEERQPQIELRERMGAAYGLDLRSKSDAGIAEAVIRQQVEGHLRRRVYRAELAPNTQLHYTTPPWVKFITPQLNTILGRVCDARYTIDNWGSPVMPEDMEDCQIHLGSETYRLGIGGLHSSESCRTVYADDDYILRDIDVASFYPAIILKSGLAPANMGDQFSIVYRDIVERRLAAKAAGEKVTADALKIVINSCFGKFGSKWSVLYAPALLLAVTLSGQLALLMAVERLLHHSIDVISANTDGIVVRCRRDQVPVLDAVIDWWEAITGFTTEAMDYRALHQRDVNNYIAIKTDGTVKAKGVYAPATLAKSPNNEICIEAVTAYLKDGTDLAATISAATDIRKFINLRKVQGGAIWKGTQLGRTARWYYGNNDTAPITYITDGKKVATSDGAIACQELPTGIPADLDRGVYLRIAIAMLTDLGVTHDYCTTDDITLDAPALAAA
jgi:hypothetical protein